MTFIKSVGLFFLFSGLVLAAPIYTAPKELVDLQEQIPDLKVDLMYSHSDNITGEPLYDKTMKAYAQPVLVEKLRDAVSALKKEGYVLVILDAYRPTDVTKILWDRALELKLENFYAPPYVGSLHNLGLAVDVTLEQNGKRLEMFSEPDDPVRYPPTPRETQNYQILKDAMFGAGFSTLKNEWWHFDLPNESRRKLTPAVEEILKNGD